MAGSTGNPPGLQEEAWARGSRGIPPRWRHKVGDRLESLIAAGMIAPIPNLAPVVLGPGGLRDQRRHGAPARASGRGLGAGVRSSPAPSVGISGDNRATLLPTGVPAPIPGLTSGAFVPGRAKKPEAPRDWFLSGGPGAAVI